MPLQAITPPRKPIDGQQATRGSIDKDHSEPPLVTTRLVTCPAGRRLDRGAPAKALWPFTVRSPAGRTAPTATSPQAQHGCVERVTGNTKLALPQQEARAPTLRDALDYQPGIVIQDFFGATHQPRPSIRGASVSNNPLKECGGLCPSAACWGHATPHGGAYARAPTRTPPPGAPPA